MNVNCFSCKLENPEGQAFCGSCGSALDLSKYISDKIEKSITSSVRDRDILETESAIRVFERAYGWVKIVGGIAIALLAIVGGGVWWKVSDWWKAVDNAKSSINYAASETSTRIKSDGQTASDKIKTASAHAEQISRSANKQIQQQASYTQEVSNRTAATLRRDQAALANDIANTRSNLQAASALRPQMTELQQQLSNATGQLQEQQKLLSNTENFVKKVFSNHEADAFILSPGQFATDNFVVIPRPANATNGNSQVYLLLRAAPIQGTLQLQYHIYSQPPGSYFVVAHNLVMFFWGDPPQNLSQQLLFATFFPDSSDKQIYKKLTVKDGKAYVDGILIKPLLSGEEGAPKP